MATFEWDAEKAETNYRKYGIGFETARKIFDDPFAVERIDPLGAEYGEERFLIIGRAEGLVLAVVYTERGENIRIISARRTTKSEHEDYYRQNAKD
jgi:uncharacterized DUF497 family protein